MSLFAWAQPARANDLSFPVIVNPYSPCSLGTISVQEDEDEFGLGGVTGFTPANGGTLEDATKACGQDETSLNWLQIVTAQPALSDIEYGPAPHVDPPLTLLFNGEPNPAADGNGGDPWYLWGDSLPPLSDTLLPFSDAPDLSSGGAISFDTYLVSLYSDNTYDVLAGFTWSATDTDHVVTIEFSELSVYPSKYVELVFNYGPNHWAYRAPYEPSGLQAPEPSVWWLMMLGLAGVGVAARARTRTVLTS